MKNWSFIVMTVLAMPAVALAQSENASPPPQPSFLEGVFFTVLPIILIGAFIWMFFGGYLRKQRTQLDAYRKHYENIEKLLERIAKALEKRNGDGG